MGTSLLSVLAVAFVLGIKHATEPDHVIAVSTVASRTKRLGSACLAGVFWGIGHTATLFSIGMILLLLKQEIPEKWAMSLEFLVGAMIVYLGVGSVFSYKKRKIHVHPHAHGEVVHNHFHSHERTETHNHPHQDVSYAKSLIIGLVHGLAGSAGMVLLTMSTVTSVWQAAVYILIFGAGTVLGMFLCTMMIGIPFVLSAKKSGLHQSLTRLVGGISTAFGCYYMYQVGVTEGLFRLW
ncbi:HoxN/HupN/NixA family nickel/cobalt transporter [Effusibacillus pohliae]|uniref:HoxN/HupN/NixA family nickel/cobalt transporter n=1 Tax=Effusibacillus pohliae TaxID=232270 RepID=UPI000375084C|nr:sulfite exporter TauE/SafE family protein [Effusibacillus pohliae]